MILKRVPENSRIRRMTMQNGLQGNWISSIIFVAGQPRVSLYCDATRETRAKLCREGYRLMTMKTVVGQRILFCKTARLRTPWDNFFLPKMAKLSQKVPNCPKVEPKQLLGVLLEMSRR